MVPPGDIGALPLWVGVFVLLGLALAVFQYAFYARVIRLVLQGKPSARFDQPLKRFSGALLISLGQQKVLQRVKYGDYAGIGHAIVFWGFLAFLLSYGIFIFAASGWRGFPEWLLTETGVRVYSSILDILAAVLFVVLIWAAARRWLVKPRRLSYDLTRHPDAVIIVVLIGGLMLSTLLTHAFWVAQGGNRSRGRRSHRQRSGRSVYRLGSGHRRCQQPAGRFLVDPPVHHTCLHGLHPLHQTHAHVCRPCERLLPVLGAQRSPPAH